jgi:co-chaperonin GroES (HSP10)
MRNQAIRNEERGYNQYELFKKKKQRLKRSKKKLVKKERNDGKELKGMIEAIGDKIVVQVLKRSKSTGGIILPETVQDPQGYGKVVSVGPDVKDKIKEGDILVMHPRGGMDVVMDKLLLKVLKADEVYGHLKNKEIRDSLDNMTLEPQKEQSTIVS